MGKAEGLTPQTAKPTESQPQRAVEHCLQCDEASLIKGRFGGIVYIFFFYYFGRICFRLSGIALAMGV